MDNSIIATFADDTAILSVDKEPETATVRLQEDCNKFLEWAKRWKIKLKEMKSIHVNVTNRKIITPLRLLLNSNTVPLENEAKYLGMTLDAKLLWNKHITKKKTELKFKYRQYYWLIGRISTLSIQNKLLIYNQIIKPIWIYGTQLWGCISRSNIKLIQKF